MDDMYVLKINNDSGDSYFWLVITARAPLLHHELVHIMAQVPSWTHLPLGVNLRPQGHCQKLVDNIKFPRHTSPVERCVSILRVQGGGIQ